MPKYNLFGGSKGQLLAQLLDQVGESAGAQGQTAPQTGGGGAQATQPPPSAAPVGQSAPTGGQPSVRPQGSPLARALGPTRTTSGGGAPSGSGLGSGMPTPPSAPSMPTSDSGMFTMDGSGSPGGSSSGQSAGDLGGSSGSFTKIGAMLGGPTGAAIGAVGDAAIEIYDAFSMDEQEKMTRAQRNLMEQQFEHRANWEEVYRTVFLPAQAGSQMYAYGKLGQKSDQYNYATDLLKGYLDGSKGVWGGTSDWDNVWQAIDGEIEAGKPTDQTFLQNVQSNYENAEVKPMQQLVIGTILGQMFPNLPKGYYMPWATELAKWGNAMMQSIGQT